MNASRKLVPIVLNLAKQQNRSIYRRNYVDPFFGLASSLMRSLDREFNQMRNSMLPSIFNGTTSAFLPSPRIFDLAPAKLQHEDAIVTDEQGNRKFHLEFDLRGFNPEEVKVKTENKMLVVSAKKEKKTDTSYFMREFSQSFTLPDELKNEDLQSKMSDGALIIEAQLPKKVESGEGQKEEKPIQIEHK